MEAFAAVAGFVGFVASIDSIINLCNRIIVALDSSTVRAEEARVLAIRRVYEKLHTLESHQQIPEKDKQILIVCNAEIYHCLCEVMQKLSASKLSSFFRKKGITGRLNTIDALLDINLKMLQLSEIPEVSRSSSMGTEQVVGAGFLPQGILQRILDPRNRKFATKQELVKEGVYSSVQKAPDSTDRFVILDGNDYIVETIPVGTNPREKATRISRLGRLILLMRNMDVDLPLAKMVKIIEQDGNLHVLSKVDGSATSLEGNLHCITDKRKVLFDVAAAVWGLHEKLIVHESIGCHNILLGPDGHVKLTGFLFARVADPEEISERERSSTDPLYGKRRMIYEAPERMSGGRYSLECDVYSLGVVMAEILLQKSFVLSPDIHSRENILSQISASSNDLSACIRECLAANARNRPTSWEVLYMISKLVDFDQRLVV